MSDDVPVVDAPADDVPNASPWKGTDEQRTSVRGRGPERSDHRLHCPLWRCCGVQVVSLTVPARASRRLSGANGGGKTSVLKALMDRCLAWVPSQRLTGLKRFVAG
jgi:hypothetical protein